MILDRIPTQDPRVSQLLAFGFTFLTFFLLLTFSAPFTGQFLVISPFVCGFIYFLVHGGRRMREFMPVFGRSLVSLALLYIAVPLACWLAWKTGFNPDIEAPIVLYFLFYPITLPFVLFFAVLLALTGSVAGFIAALSIRR